MPLSVATPAVALLLWLLVSLTKNYFSLPRTFPGPFFASVSEFWLAWQAMTANLVDAEISLLKEYASQTGPTLVRIAPKVLLTDDPDLLRYVSMPKSRWTRSGWYDGNEFGGETRHVFAEREEGRHKELRAKLGNAYSGKGVENLELCIDTQLSAFIKLLREEYARPDKALDMARVSTYFTLDVLSYLSFGIPFGYIAANADKWDYISSGESFFPVIQLVCNHAAFRAVFQNSLVQKLLAPKPTDKAGFGALTGFSAREIERRFKEKDSNRTKDMLASFMAHGLSLEECQSEGLIQVIAGSDSTSTIIRMTMLHIITTPRIYYALQREVDTAAVHGKLQDNEVISEAAARKLPFLQAVIWEGLRKTPPLFGLLSKLAPAEGETINGIYFPPNCELTACLQSVTHHPAIFGPDADVFRPERWLEADTETRSKYERTTELIFGSGRYGCLGRHVAWMEWEKVFFELMRRFEWQIADPLRPVKESRGHALWVQKGMGMRVMER